MGDGFQTKFRKVSRAGRRSKAIPDGHIQMLMSNFVVSSQSFVGGGPCKTLVGRKRKVEPEPAGEFKKFKRLQAKK